jgi:mannose-6-phosphate isomerase-like protein (cupin superfamily)
MVVSNLHEEFAAVTEYWSPRVVAEANGQYVKIAKVKGEFVWHSHADEDEFFLVSRGTFTIRYRDCEVILKEGDFHVVPRGREHMTSRGGLGRLRRTGRHDTHGRGRGRGHEVDRRAVRPPRPVDGSRDARRYRRGTRFAASRLPCRGVTWLPTSCASWWAPSPRCPW